MPKGSEKAPRAPKLRESCDECYGAKVKCSKEKPICGRCLQQASKGEVKECKYSPSARTGKPSADSTRPALTQAHPSMYTTGNTNTNTMAYSHQMQMTRGPDRRLADEMQFWSQQHANGSPLYGSNQPGGMGVSSYASQATMQHSSMPAGSMSPFSISPCSMPASPMAPGPIPVGSMAPVSTPTWTSFHDQFTMPCDHFNASADGQYRPQGHSRGSSCHSMMMPDSQLQAALDVQQMYDLGQTPLPTPPNSGISTLPYSTMKHHEVPPPMVNRMGSSAIQSQHVIVQQSSQGSRGMDGATGTCTCYKTCIRSLESLSSASEKLDTTSVDTIMKLNAKAVDSCLYMLNCPRCTGPLKSKGASILANIIVAISELYKHVIEKENPELHDVTGDFPNPQLSTKSFLAAQRVPQRLSTLQAVRQKFSEQCMTVQDEYQLRSALVSWVDQTMPSQATGDEDIKKEDGFDFRY